MERLDADLNDPDRTAAVKLRKLDGQDGEYVVPVSFNRAGRYRLAVDSKNGSPAKLEYRVSLPPDHELASLAPAEAELKKLAADGSGKFYHEEDLYRLSSNVVPQYAPFTRRDETEMWNWKWMLVLISLLSVEWFMRKFNGLS